MNKGGSHTQQLLSSANLLANDRSDKYLKLKTHHHLSCHPSYNVVYWLVKMNVATVSESIPQSGSLSLKALDANN